MRMSRRTSGAIALAVSALVLATGCSRGEDAETAESAATTSSASEESAAAEGGESLVIGTSLPLTGPLQAFGTSLQLGYQQAIDEVNASGGLAVGDTTYQVELKVEDNASDGNKASEQVKSLVLDDGAAALLGPATPPITIPVSVAAEQLQVPLISTITPIRAWLGANPEGWKWSYDVFFDEVQMTQTQFQASDLIETNKKIALFTDQEEDGVVMGGLWEETAPGAGYEVVYRGEFPVGNTNFTQQVKEAKESGAEIVIAQVIPPDGISLLREMKSQAWQPKAVFIEKAGNTGGYPGLSEGLADGVMAANWFAEGMGLPMESDFIAQYKDQLGGVNSDLGCVIYGYSIAKVLLAAFTAAGTTDPAAVNEAIAATDMETPAGQVTFDAQHASAQAAVQTQWVGTDMVLVMNADGSAGPNAIVTPIPGLK
jgi:branched-chain amino acid transport system substrate-binding protein